MGVCDNKIQENHIFCCSPRQKVNKSKLGILNDRFFKSRTVGKKIKIW